MYGKNLFSEICCDQIAGGLIKYNDVKETVYQSQPTIAEIINSI